MKSKLTAACTALSVFCLGALTAHGQSVPIEPLVPAPVADGGGGPVDETPQLWFVELVGPPVADGGSAARIKAEKQAFRSSAAKAGLAYRERYAFDTLFNGFSIAVSPGQLGRLSRLDGVKALYPVDTVRLPELEAGARPELFTALAMTGADVAQNALGLDGSGVRVAVMDTGVDIDHPDFGGSGVNGTTGFPTARIVAGWDFVGDDFNADSSSPDFNPVPTPDPVPDDCNGHGTHVAGIVGANGSVKGVAPNVSIGAYRVFGCEGSTTADIMIAAMERAQADGMHVLNMSIGSSFQWPEYPTARAASRLVERGMVVAASIGNSGASGLYAAGAPGVGEKVIGVASFNNSHARLPYFTISPDATPIGYNAATGAPPPPTSGTQPMARTGTTASTNDACTPLPAGSLAGRVALIRRGTCSFHAKSLNAQNAGAIGVVLYNNATGRFNPTVAGAPPITIPVVAVSDTEGVLIDGRLAGGPVELTWTNQRASFPDPINGGLIASSSSYGMAHDLSLKPDIGAPGGAIFSTYPLESGAYATLGGTSMASPHVAGAAALVLQAAPKTDSELMRALLQNNASPQVWWGNPGLGFLDNVHRQGAGMVQVDKTILASSRITPGKLSLGESESGPSTRNLKVDNLSTVPVTYTASFENALSTGFNSFSPSFFTSSAGVAFNQPSFTIPGRGNRTIQATITPASAPDGGLYGGYIVLTPDNGEPALRVPFAGYIGDYQARQVLVPTGNGFPWLARFNGSGYSNRPAGETYSMVDALNIPYFAVHFDHAARLARFEVFEAATGKSMHRAFEFEYLPRNSTATGFFAFGWDGTTTVGIGNKQFTVPNGDYVVRLSVLKALGDTSNPAHWETWTSPVITIARP